MSDEMPATGAMLDSPPASEVPKQGFFSTSTGKLVAVIIGLGVLGVIVGIVFAIVAFVFVGQAVDEIDVQIPEATSTPAPGGQQETPPAAASPAPELANSAVFTFRNIFEPLLKPIPEPSTDVTPTPDPDNETPTTRGTLYVTDIITEDGVLKAVLSLDNQTYTLAVGERIPGTPWQVLRLTSSQVTMLYGDVQVTLGIGQGITK